ncbi:hypothetical protein [Halobaculum limi]|uniref:hypothetical protein n=1 Tax=Halobaculum limi TaxID=3031916 RepID=UPI002405E2D4|nr:hypothetical protein [Halobaculum sp. YSMS11]
MSDALHLGAFALQAGIIAGGVVALKRRDASAAVNAVFSLSVAVVPFLLPAVTGDGVAQSLASSPTLPLWLAFAGFVHVVGMLGWYDTVWWWDHLTHTVSAALLASLVYSAVVVVFGGGGASAMSSSALAVVTVAFVFAAGVFWEVIELAARDISDWLDIDPFLVHYGWRDTAYDLVFDLVGALLVVWFDLALFKSVAAAAPSATRTLLLVAGWVVVLGTVGLSIPIAVSSARRRGLFGE